MTQYKCVAQHNQSKRATHAALTFCFHETELSSLVASYASLRSWLSVLMAWRKYSESSRAEDEPRAHLRKGWL